jgi:hypothetical protein
MEVKRIVNEQVDFVPRSVNITVDTQEELEYLQEAFVSLTESSLRQDVTAGAAEVIMDLLERIYNEAQ